MKTVIFFFSIAILNLVVVPRSTQLSIIIILKNHTTYLCIAFLMRRIINYIKLNVAGGFFRAYGRGCNLGWLRVVDGKLPRYIRINFARRRTLLIYLYIYILQFVSSKFIMLIIIFFFLR